MKLYPDSKFTATLLANDPKTNFKKGKTFHPKGVYWNKKKVILVGDKDLDNTIRISFPENIVQVEVNP